METIPTTHNHETVKTNDQALHQMYEQDSGTLMSPEDIKAYEELIEEQRAKHREIGAVATASTQEAQTPHTETPVPSMRPNSDPAYVQARTDSWAATR